MNETHRKGLIGELGISQDLIKRGYDVYIPYGEGSNYDLIVDRHKGCLESVQCKCCSSENRGVLQG